MYLRIVLIVLLLVNVESLAIATEDVLVGGVHATLTCQACHGESISETPSPSSAESHAAGCVTCHQGYDKIFSRAMTTRREEQNFAQSFKKFDKHFFANNCNECHVSDCLDCHGGDGHNIAPASQDGCLSCHQGYYTGWEYLGMAPREDDPRYQRGGAFQGKYFLKMRPDIHAEKGLECMDCHTMKSLIAGESSAKKCRDCHDPDPSVIEHGIAAHMEKMECYSCHSAWVAQEYGTFFLRIDKNDPETLAAFHVDSKPAGDYIVRNYLRKQDSPLLGVNEKGLISPIRPQFIAYYSDVRRFGDRTQENVLVSAQWKACFPHTVRRGTPLCDACHDNPRRYLMEKEEDRIYRIDLDGLGLSSFWSQAGQHVVNGQFLSAERVKALSVRTPAFVKGYVEKWKKLINHVEDSSR